MQVSRYRWVVLVYPYLWTCGALLKKESNSFLGACPTIHGYKKIAHSELRWLVEQGTFFENRRETLYKIRSFIENTVHVALVRQPPGLILLI